MHYRIYSIKRGSAKKHYLKGYEPTREDLAQAYCDSMNTNPYGERWEYEKAIDDEKDLSTVEGI